MHLAELLHSWARSKRTKFKISYAMVRREAHADPSFELNIGVELCLAVKLSTIQLTVKINPGLQLLCFITPCD